MISKEQNDHINRIKKWAIIGFFIGIVGALLMLYTGERDNFGDAFGTALGGAFWGAIFALIRNKFK
ncbi:hypothetical protein N9M53_05670 [Alphaproteobacteria bacterium]|nr:hypothetical protein [Alphaproteobacteria bacterium]